MLFFCVCLGLQQITLKATIGDISPILQIGLRSAVAALLLSAVMVWQKIGFSLGRSSLLSGIAIGVLFTLEYIFLGQALHYTTASRAVVFVYTSPMFTALVLHFVLPSERLNRGQWFGMLVAFAGLALAFLGKDEGVQREATLWGDLLAMCAGLAWGGTTIIIRLSHLAEARSEQILWYQLVVSALLLILAAVFMGETYFNPVPAVWLSLAFQAVVISFVALMIWFWLLQNYLASRVGVLSFMTPLMGVGFGWLFLNEPVELDFLIGAVLVVAGIVMGSGNSWLRQLLRRRG